MVWNKLTIEDVKAKLSELTKDVVILSNTYEGNKSNMDCKCLVCDNEFSKSWNQLSKGKHCPSCGKNGIKISKQEIQEHVKKHGYEVIKFTKDDSNKGTMFEIRCPKDHTYETSYREFNREEYKRSGSCKQCNRNNVGRARRTPVVEVANNISKWGYVVESNFEYKNGQEKHKFICKKGHVRFLGYNSLKEHPKCPECDGRILRHTEESISKILCELGLEYIDGYIGNKSKFKFKCSCGRTDENYLGSLVDGIRCRECNDYKIYTFDEVKSFFEDEGYELFEDKYINSKFPMKYKCNKGHERKITLNSFLRGGRCRDCYDIGRSGKNSRFWNPNLTDDERKKNRKYPKYKEWRRLVYERDNYTCQCCGNDAGHNLNAHHLDSHDWAKDKRLDVENGKTLCESCHKDFHNKYGYGNNTKEQFDEYLTTLLLDKLKTNKKEPVTQ